MAVFEARVGELSRWARERGFPGEVGGLGLLVQWVEGVVGCGVNLTGVADVGRGIGVLAASAFAVVRAVARAPRLVVDLGSGNGLVGVVAAVAWPGARVWLVERRARKAEALAALVGALGPANVEVVPVDGRALLAVRPDARGAVDLVTVRAVGTLAETTSIAAPWLAPGGRVAHWKGRGLDEAEAAEGLVEVRRAGLVARETLSFDDEVGPARLVVYERARASVGRRPKGG